MNKKVFFQFLNTITMTILVTLAMVLGFVALIQYQVEQEQIEKIVQEDSIDYDQINLEIEKNKYLQQQNPSSYKLNLKLGILYQVKHDYPSAEREFEYAAVKSPYGEYKPNYMLALLYIAWGKLDDAQATMDKIEEKPDKKLINYKGEIYNRLGDKYYNAGAYDDAIYRYQKALFYFKIIKSPKISLVKGNLASAYIYYAEQKVNEMDIDEAILYLQKAKELINAPITNYKLALLLMQTDPEVAFRYFDQVFKDAPEILNYETYNGFLSMLIQAAVSEGDVNQAELYRFKQRKLKEYFKTNIISVEDIYLDSAEGNISLSKWKKKYKIEFECKLKNLSKYNMNSLFLRVVFKANEKILYIHTQQIFNQDEVFKAFSTSPFIIIKEETEKTKDEYLPENVKAQVFVSKTENSYRIFIGEVPIKQKQKKKYTFKLFHQKFEVPKF